MPTLLLILFVFGSRDAARAARDVFFPSGPPGWTDADIRAALDFCAAEGIADPATPLGVWAAESDNDPTAHNPQGDASGIFQLMPATAVALGWDPDDTHLDAFRRLPVADQMPWAIRFYAPHRGRLATPRDFYLRTFLPFADRADGVLAGRDGPRAAVYAANAGLDVTAKGFLVADDLTAAAARRDTSPRTRDLVARARAALAEGTP